VNRKLFLETVFTEKLKVEIRLMEMLELSL